VEPARALADAPESSRVARRPERPASRTEPAAHLASLPSSDEASQRPEHLARDEEIRRWLNRYAAALSAHDVETLRRMGAVTNEREIAMRELDVELDVIALRHDGDRTTVVFTRRDRFRDAVGHLVLKESPTLERQIVRTPDGLRFARPAG